MATVKTDDQNYKNIANAIREKTGASNTYLPSEMDDAIREIETTNIEMFSVVTPEMYGAFGDGVTDDTVAWQAAVDSGKNVFATKSAYKCGTINVTKNISIDCNGASFVCTAETLFNCAGEVIESIPGADYVANAPYALDDDYTGLAMLRSEDNIITTRTYYYGGFVTMFANGVCNDCKPVSFSGVTVDKIKPITCKICNVGNVTHANNIDTNYTVYCLYGVNCEFSNFAVDGEKYSVVTLRKCYRCTISEINGFDSYTGSKSNYYPIEILDSSECVTENCNLTCDWWHCWTTGGNYICFDNKVIDCVFHVGTGGVAVCDHDCAIGTYIEGCVIDSCEFFGESTIKNTKIIANKSDKTSSNYICRIHFHPTNLSGSNNFYAENIDFVYDANTIPTNSYNFGFSITGTAQTTQNDFFVDDVTLKDFYTSDNTFANFAGFRVSPPSSLMRSFTMQGKIVLDNIVGVYSLTEANGALIAFTDTCKMYIKNCNRIKASGDGGLKVGDSSANAFPKYVEIRDCLLHQINGIFTELRLFNVWTTHYVMGAMKGTKLVAADVSRINNSNILAFTNAHINTMEYADTQYWDYVYANNGTGCYGAISASGITNKTLS